MPITMTIDEESKVVGVILTSVSADSIVTNQEILDRQAVLIALVLLIVVFGIAVAVPRGIMKPFDKVTTAINEVKAGFTDEKIEAKDYTELEHIVDAFNQLMARMKVLDDSRQEFVSNVSHELKTPLTSVKVLADSLNTQEDVPVELYKEFMTDIVHEIDRENKIINDLLSLVKLDKTASELNIESVDINKLMESIFKRLMPLAKEQGIDLIFESQRQVIAEVDEVKLSLAITNLIENGIKYNREEGWVKVTLDADHQFFTFEVADSGLGIAEEDRKHIFERFYRVDKSHSREIGGTGLGLAITRSTILMHRGSIKVSSELGEGTVFTVKVPLSYIQ
ncbi:MAG: two-component sensor histidine kinase [Lachnospiraceae bacterium]|nr:two-component sensor histidine kinase [Lachnospiraceae bacterium]